MGDARVEIFSFLNLMVEKAGSDLFFSVGAPVNLKIEGITHPLKMPALRPGQVKQLPGQIEDLLKDVHTP